jgi:hypothetical protein
MGLLLTIMNKKGEASAFASLLGASALPETSTPVSLPSGILRFGKLFNRPRTRPRPRTRSMEVRCLPTRLLGLPASTERVMAEDAAAQKILLGAQGLPAESLFKHRGQLSVSIAN